MKAAGYRFKTREFKTFSKKFDIYSRWKDNTKFGFKETRQIDGFNYENKKILFKKPITAIEYSKGNHYFIEYPPLTIIVYDTKLDEAREIFLEMLESLYEDYGLESNENLTKSGIEFKNKILDLIDETKEN